MPKAEVKELSGNKCAIFGSSADTRVRSAETRLGGWRALAHGSRRVAELLISWKLGAGTPACRTETGPEGTPGARGFLLPETFQSGIVACSSRPPGLRHQASRSAEMSGHARGSAAGEVVEVGLNSGAGAQAVSPAHTGECQCTLSLPATPLARNSTLPHPEVYLRAS